MCDEVLLQRDGLEVEQGDRLVERACWRGEHLTHQVPLGAGEDEAGIRAALGKITIIF